MLNVDGQVYTWVDNYFISLKGRELYIFCTKLSPQKTAS